MDAVLVCFGSNREIHRVGIAKTIVLGLPNPSGWDFQIYRVWIAESVGLGLPNPSGCGIVCLR